MSSLTCTRTRIFLFTFVLSGPSVEGTVPFNYAGDTKECMQSSVTVCWKRPHNVSFPLIRWPLRHPDGPTKYRLTLSIINSHSFNITNTLKYVCVHKRTLAHNFYFIHPQEMHKITHLLTGHPVSTDHTKNQGSQKVYPIITCQSLNTGIRV